MAELTTIARPYAKAAFDFAVEHQAVENWAEMLDFAAMVSENESMKPLLAGSMSSNKLAALFINICGEQIDEHGQNLIKVMAETVAWRYCLLYLSSMLSFATNGLRKSKPAWCLLLSLALSSNSRSVFL